MARPADCPVCGTVGVYSGLRCSTCGVYYRCPNCRHDLPSAALLEPACPYCGSKHEVPQRALDAWRARGAPPLAASSEVTAGDAGAVPSPEPLLGPARDWLMTLESGPVPGVRSAMAGLARAYRGAGRLEEAAAGYRQALAQEGDQPSEVVLRAGLAVTQLAGTAPQEGVRNLLLAIDLARGPAGLIAAVLTALTPTMASSLADWLNDIWLPDIGRSCPPNVIAVGQVLHAAALLLTGRDDAAMAGLTAAARADKAAARKAWAAWAGTADADSEALAVARPDPLARTAVRARAEHALGSDGEARALADQIIDAGTIIGPPQIAAYRLRSDLPGRSRQERAGDLVNAVAGLVVLGARNDLELAVDLLDEAGRLDPRQLDVSWYRADALRMLAYQHSSSDYPVLDELRAAGEAWDAARRHGRPTTPWPWLVLAQICECRAEGEGASARVWWRGQLLAAAQAAQAGPAWSTAWASAADAARCLMLTRTCGWALGHCLQLIGAPSADYSFEFGRALNCWRQFEPDGVARRLDETLGAFQADEPWIGAFRAEALLHSGDLPGAIQQMAQALGPVPKPWHQVMYARLLALADEEGAETAIGQALKTLGDIDPRTDPEVLLAQANLSVYRGQPSEARELVTRLRALGPEVNVDPATIAGSEMIAALMLGDLTAAAAARDRLLAGLYPMLAIDVALDLDWLARRPRAPGAVPSDLAISWQADLKRAAAELPDPLGADAAAALAEVDTALAAAVAGDAGEMRALGAVRALIADDVRGSLGTSHGGSAGVQQPSDLPVGLRIEMGVDLLPSDSLEKSAEWPLISVLIPQMRQRLQQRLGYPVQGVRVMDDASLEPTQYVVKLDGRPSGRGLVDPSSVPRPAVPISEYPSPEPWTEAVAALEAAISSAADHCLTPEALGALLAQWAANAGPQAEFVPRFDAQHLDQRIRLWRALRAMVSHQGRIAAWDDGLADLVVSLAGPSEEPGPDQPPGSEARP